MEDQEFKVIKTFIDLTEAKVAQSKLEAHGIDCWLDNENLASLNWFYMNLTGGVRLRVESRNEEEAKLILQDIEEPSNTEKDEPNSSKLKKRVIWLTILALLIALFFGII